MVPPEIKNTISLGFAENFLQALEGMNEPRPRSSGIRVSFIHLSASSSAT